MQTENVGKRCATRQDLSLKKDPDSGRRGRDKVRVGVFAQLDFFLFADDLSTGAEDSTGQRRSLFSIIGLRARSPCRIRQ
jgi:hypothetical protein